MSFMVDSHCHLHFPPYDTDRDAVLQRMRDADIAAITVGTTLGTSARAIAFAASHENVWATVGYHPEHFSSTYHDEAEGDADVYDIAELKKLAQSSPKVVAIGETGLDFYRIDEGRDRDEAIHAQEKGLREQMAIARELHLPLVFHCRDALTRLAEIVSEERDAGRSIEGVVHCYTGTWEEAKPLLDLGLYLSFTGVITFPMKKTQDPETHVHRVIERMSLDRLLVETDAPWLTPIPHRGERNEPAYVQHVAEMVAGIRNTDLQTIARVTTENAHRLFHL